MQRVTVKEGPVRVCLPRLARRPRWRVVAFEMLRKESRLSGLVSVAGGQRHAVLCGSYKGVLWVQVIGSSEATGTGFGGIGVVRLVSV